MSCLRIELCYLWPVLSPFDGHNMRSKGTLKKRTDPLPPSIYQLFASGYNRKLPYIKIVILIHTFKQSNSCTILSLPYNNLLYNIEFRYRCFWQCHPIILSDFFFYIYFCSSTLWFWLERGKRCCSSGCSYSNRRRSVSTIGNKYDWTSKTKKFWLSTHWTTGSGRSWRRWE